MWRRREGPQVPLRRSRYWLASETFLLDRGLEEVSFPNSLTLFLVIIGSQVKPWTEASCIGFPPSVAFKVRVSTVGKKKKIPISPVFWGREEILDAVVKVDPALGMFWQLSRGHLLSKFICSFFRSPQGRWITPGFLCLWHLHICFRNGWVIAEVPSNLETLW